MCDSVVLGLWGSMREKSAIDDNDRTASKKKIGPLARSTSTALRILPQRINPLEGTKTFYSLAIAQYITWPFYSSEVN